MFYKKIYTDSLQKIVIGSERHLTIINNSPEIQKVRFGQSNMELEPNSKNVFLDFFSNSPDDIFFENNNCEIVIYAYGGNKQIKGKYE